MQKNLFRSLLLLTLLAAAVSVLPSSYADNLGKGSAEVTFNKDVAPIFFKHCADCHRPGEAAPMPLLSYKDARPWAKSIREKVASRTMPPWHADPQHGVFSNDRRLTPKELETVVAWVEGGTKEGNPSDLPPAPKFVEGWGIGKPDAVFSMPEEFTVEASGPDEYQYFEVPTNFTEDRYVQAVEARPGNRKVVHHIVVSVVPSASTAAPVLSKEEAEKLRAQQEKESLVYRDGFLQRTKADAPIHNDGCQLPNGGSGLQRDTNKRSNLDSPLFVWAPGRDSNVWEPGTAMKIPANSKLRFQVHYSKVAGSVQKDRSSIGLIFAKEPPAKLLLTGWVYNTYFQIPPGSERHHVTACWTVPEDIQIKAFMPHMHVRGAAMEVKAFYPDGRSAVLLNVPRYDFNWQANYTLRQPLSVPKGTRIFVAGDFDNSAKNKFNPDPSKTVRHGHPTYDEMFICFVDYTKEVKPADAPVSGQASPRQ